MSQSMRLCKRRFIHKVAYVYTDFNKYISSWDLVRRSLSRGRNFSIRCLSVHCALILTQPRSMLKIMERFNNSSVSTGIFTRGIQAYTTCCSYVYLRVSVVFVKHRSTSPRLRTSVISTSQFSSKFLVILALNRKYDSRTQLCTKKKVFGTATLVFCYYDLCWEKMPIIITVLAQYSYSIFIYVFILYCRMVENIVLCIKFYPSLYKFYRAAR